MRPRGEKETNLDTIGYEIDMLDFALERYRDLKSQQKAVEQGDLNVYLECFLLHYRNLVEFFSDKLKHKKG